MGPDPGHLPAPLPDVAPVDGLSNLDERDAAHLERARLLGRLGWGRVHPNPMVGCVIATDDRVVGEGWHRNFGGPHAEIMALEAAGPEARGATVYVSLEPCRHHGKTPPCTTALIEAGIDRVVFGAADPGEASGQGGPALREAGIEVVGPVYSREEAARENPGFFASSRSRPWTVLKLAVSIDGALTRDPGAPTALSGPEAIRRVHHLRSGMDAILVGAGTVRSDQPRLTVREGFEPRIPPVRVILDPGPDWDPGATPLHPNGPPVWVAVSRERFDERARGLESIGLRVLPIDPIEGGRIDPEALMVTLRKSGISSLLCEGGARWGRAMLAAGLVDRLIMVTAPRSLGPEAVSAFPFPEGRWAPLGEPLRIGRDIWSEWDRED